MGFDCTHQPYLSFRCLLFQNKKFGLYPSPLFHGIRAHNGSDHSMITFGSMRAFSASAQGATSEASSASSQQTHGTTLTAPLFESTPTVITGHRFDGSNYLEWSQSVLMFIRGRGKEEYLTGDAVQPPTSDPKHKQWVAENNMLMSWLVNSMTTSMGKNYLLCTTAKDIWEAVRETYSARENKAVLLELEGLIHELKQGEQTVTDYYNALCHYWQQQDLYQTYKWTCAADAIYYQQLVEEKRIYKFLLGLNSTFDEMRGRIMGVQTLPTLREVFSMVKHEESRRKLTNGGPSSLPPSDAAALLTHHSRGGDTKPKRQGRLFCDHCHKTGHSKDSCWKLHGKPSDWKPRQQRNAQGLMVASEDRTEPTLFSKEQLELIQRMIGNHEPNSSKVIGAGIVAQKGNHLMALNTQAPNTNTWIVDSGATDHMAGNTSLLDHYVPCSQKLFVTIADGSLSEVSGIGEVRLSESLLLKDVLIVPKLTCNLLSVSKLAKSSNCLTQFHSHGCHFQDLESGRTIGSAREYEGLYYVQGPDQRNKSAMVTCSISKNDVLLWRYRLKHPSINYMKQMLP